MSEPTNGELARRLDEIQRMLAGLVLYPEYREHQRGIDHRFTEVTQDIEELRRQHADDVKALSGRIDAQDKAVKEHRTEWRSLILTGVLPALVTALGILVTVLISTHGGH